MGGVKWFLAFLFQTLCMFFVKTLIVRYHVWVAIEEQEWAIQKLRQAIPYLHLKHPYMSQRHLKNVENCE
jgi:cell division protein FtsB